jgi:penicillin-binding protein 2
MMFNFFKRNKRINTHSIDPDEIFMDTLNVSGFNTQQFEGMIERSITKKVFTVMGVVFVAVGIIFSLQLLRLQVISGGSYLRKSENNRLHHTPIFADRGVIYDRNGKELAWNITGAENEPFSVREYIPLGGFAHLIGYVGYPTKDSSGFFWQNEIIGKSGIEKRLDRILSGTNGQKIVELDATQKLLSENLVKHPILGENVTLTIDAQIQSAMYNAIKDLADKNGFEGGAGVMMDIHTGEILAITSYPEYDLNILSHGDDRATIARYAVDPRHVYLNRTMAGLYTPGSTVKPYLALGALNEGIITPSTTVYSEGQVEIPNRYDPTKPQAFRDWKKGGHGVTNVYKAIAESVNTFFYAIGGGYKNQQGLGITRIDEYVQKFGLNTKTGIDMDGEVVGTVPSPEWKMKTFPNDGTWRLGDTYNSAIGQFGFQVTTLELVRAVAALANGGDLVQPYVTMTPKTQTAAPVRIEGIDPKWYEVIHDAMRKTVTEGTAQVANVPFVHAAIKTGTAQVGPRNSFMNSWSTGFFPYENPKYAFVIVMDKAKSTNETGATYVVRQMFDAIWNANPNFFSE